MSDRWVVEQNGGTAREHHEVTVSFPMPWARICVVTDEALVLGSAQADDVVDADAVARRGVDVVRRRSGGGAVLVEPDAQLWIDLWVPRSDPLWSDDVVRSFSWLGEMWVRALASLGVDAEAHEGRLRAGPWGKLVCFAGLGPGEISVGGRKVVGMSQHRSREGAQFHTMALLRWEPARLLELLALSDHRRRAAATELADSAAAVPVDRADLVGAVLAELP